MDVMNISNRNVVDLSSFFVFEVTGDSESCSNFDSAVTEESSVALDEDDAESCSWDLSTDDDRLYASIGSDSLDHNIGEEFVIDYMEEDDYEDEDEATSDPAFRKWSDSTGEINIGHQEYPICQNTRICPFDIYLSLSFS
ncbi:uncharacterized protein LOC133793900 [Humulus lupulus]|uniref:uncharacterized protein LOC133793900 n=1 Tax=Humulus lupulus TaxID=3486 RepID=UPI002B40E709|nr:uncharacterized protein LOC133793900 [Humulus lupulus]XP_062087131.1 uncharacterized protein LOC133793900 [Humulus lupulus]XP_062087135.1 uncharacterized protein LOC133793900 [Humulus lupulus]